MQREQGTQIHQETTAQYKTPSSCEGKFDRLRFPMAQFALLGLVAGQPSPKGGQHEMLHADLKRQSLECHGSKRWVNLSQQKQHKENLKKKKKMLKYETKGTGLLFS